MIRSGFFWNDQKSRLSLIIEPRFRNTSSKPIMIEEVSKNWMELSSLSEEKLIMLLQEMNNFDKINKFFMNNYWNKIENFVKLMRKVSTRWKNWSDVKALHSIQFQGEDWSKIETLSLSSQARLRKYRMKLIAWMIREIFKMLNQCVVDNPTLSVNQRFSHLSEVLAKCWAVLGECWAATTGRQVFGTRMVYRATFFCKSNGVFFSTLSAIVKSMEL